MKSLSIRNIPTDMYDKLQSLAKCNRRSMREQVIWMLENEVKMLHGSSLDKAAEWRNRLKNRRFSDTVQSVREDRER